MRRDELAQNFPVFDRHYYWRVPGRLLFLLTRRPLDTLRLRPGTYTVKVSAEDICGNRGTLAQPIRIVDAPA